MLMQESKSSKLRFFSMLWIGIPLAFIAGLLGFGIIFSFIPAPNGDDLAFINAHERDPLTAGFAMVYLFLGIALLRRFARNLPPLGRALVSLLFAIPGLALIASVTSSQWQGSESKFEAGSHILSFAENVTFYSQFVGFILVYLWLLAPIALVIGLIRKKRNNKPLQQIYTPAD